jgi:hypothetical protein
MRIRHAFIVVEYCHMLYTIYIQKANEKMLCEKRKLILFIEEYSAILISIKFITVIFLFDNPYFGDVTSPNSLIFNNKTHSGGCELHQVLTHPGRKAPKNNSKEPI